MTSHERAKTFHALHDDVLVLPNAWDAASARLIQEAGAPAIATTSGGVAWALGAADGQALDPTALFDAVRRIVAAVDVPVSADIEAGFGDVAATVAGVIEAGAVGINLEDSESGTLLAIDTMAERVCEARAVADAAGVPLFVNARTDVYLLGVNDLDDAVARARAYAAAGADGVFAPGLSDLGALAAVTQAVDVPVNAMAGPGSPSVRELAAAGVCRISTGTALAQAAYGLTERLARAVLADGTFDALAGGADYGRMNALLANS
ncbi:MULTISPECIES: isocitrate lyase/PEP mutase family protein [Mumia]|uniref:isocitrate lyase/PEP mutase family protein n=1 Tax=Mumia TaxID=1546255 RepID=UPI0015FB603D|nr:isocitrate lyase/phosphoenolpyruvate mutase family protein [Mumia sp. ZJ1417]QMW65436.1 isocitrate lyase/phosphoenolpyruvate mutase family protein [Mumia sp. ZJ1417]